MAEVIPVEHETGMPLALAPNADGLPPVDLPHHQADWHHLFNPSDSEEIKTRSGFALQQLVVEWVDENDHKDFHQHFDPYMKAEWRFAKTLPDRVGSVILGAAGYIPPVAIRMSRHGGQYVDLPEHERIKMWQTGILRMGSESVVYQFLRKTILNQKLQTVVNESDIEQFVLGNDTDERKELGNRLLEAAAELATDSVRPMYLAAYKKRLLLPKAQAEPKELILSQPHLLGTEKRKRKTRTALWRRLAKDLGIDIGEAA